MPAEETRANARFMVIDRAFVKSFVQGAPAELVKFTKVAGGWLGKCRAWALTGADSRNPRRTFRGH